MRRRSVRPSLLRVFVDIRPRLPCAKNGRTRQNPSEGGTQLGKNTSPIQFVFGARAGPVGPGASHPVPFVFRAIGNFKQEEPRTGSGFGDTPDRPSSGPSAIVQTQD